jgi:hypothetical protein
MKLKELNPFQRQGKRNVFCRYYSECLDAVVKKSWTYWSCAECEHRFNREAEPDILDNVSHSVAYYDISTRRGWS